ncbi:MAG: Crp/Fnr family transcriptional regulator [Chitinophagaceae bacterium]
MDHYQALQHFLERFLVLPPDDLAELKHRSEVVHFKKRAIITNAGDAELHLYFVVKGLIREYFYKGKQEVTTDIISENTITGSVTSFFTGAPSHYCLQAMEPCTLISIHKGKLEELYRSDRKWERFGRVLTAHFLMQQEWNILNSVRFTPREMFIQFFEKQADLLQRVPQKHLASYLRIKPETFSRMKHLLRRQKKNNHNHAA